MGTGSFLRSGALALACAAVLAALVLAGGAGLSRSAADGEVVASARGSSGGGGPGLLPEDPARGLVYAGIRTASSDGFCKTRFEIQTLKRGVVCTHGPDPAPTGRDVRDFRPFDELRQLADLPPGGTPTASSNTVPCIGDGVSGNRVQAIYAHAAGTASRYSTLLPLIRAWAADVETVVNGSAAETGGTRDVRFVTDSNCQLVVLDVALSATGDDTFQNTIDELTALGYKRSDRKYLVWMDANIYCGIAQLYNDDRASQDNYNNGNSIIPGMIARIDNACWGLLSADHSVETHELVHTLGAVMPSAPNHSPNGHCLDESDTMCYADAQGVTMRQVCPLTEEQFLDCGDDDYFNTNPASGSYLATHWNVAGSSFLLAGTTAVAPTISSFSPAAGPTGTTVTISGVALAGATAVNFNGRSAAFTVLSPSSIKATVPSGATTGKIVVQTPAGSATSGDAFSVTLSVSGISPASGPVGTTVSISGVGFSGASAVKFNGIQASYSVVSSTSIRATVPSGATTGRVTVTAPAGTVAGAGSFTVTPSIPPTISGFTPTSGPTGTKVTISGSYFSGAGSVRLGGLDCTFNVVSPTTITAVVPAGATSTRFTVKTPVGTVTSSQTFTVTLSITGFSPASGPAGTAVVISGVGLSGATRVAFNGTSAAFAVTSATSIRATVPAAATTGRITVTTPAGTVQSRSSFTKT